MWLSHIIFAVVTCLALSLDVESHLASTLSTRQIGAGKGYVDLPILQEPKGFLYTLNISIGQPAQELAITLDTGSADLWIHDWRSPSCGEDLCAGGFFVPTLSDSYDVREEGAFNISYFTEGDWHAGDWGNDFVTFQDGTQLTSQLLGVVINNGFDELYRYAIMGLRFADNEQIPLPLYGAAGTILDSLVSQGLIGRRSFGLYLNDRDTAMGSILLGGLDSMKYTGDLVALPLVAGFGAVADEYGYWVPCSLKSRNGTLNYGLGGNNGVTISVPMSQMFTYKGYGKWVFSDESGCCWFDFAPFPGPKAGILGDSFLRSAYVVYDVDNNIAAVGQAALNSLHTSNIVILPASDTTIPGVARTGTATVVNSFYTYSSSFAYTPDATLMAQTVYGVIQAGTPTFNLGEAVATRSTSPETPNTSRTTNAAAATATATTTVTTTASPIAAADNVRLDFSAIVAIQIALNVYIFIQEGSETTSTDRKYPGWRTTATSVAVCDS